jgi:hypothetical protein
MRTQTMRELTEVVATRKLYGSVPANKSSVIRIGKPRKVSETEWECPFHISNAGMPGVAFGHGIDALQALVQAIDGCRVFLERSGTTFRWEGGENGDTGVPRFVPAMFGAEFANHVGRMIDKEVENFARLAAGRHDGRRRSRGSAGAKKGQLKKGK